MVFGFTMIILIFILIPFSIASKQVFQKDVGMLWLTAFKPDEEFIDGVFNSIATSDVITEPAIKDSVTAAADKNSPLGAALRKVVTPESLEINAKENAALVYNWLASDSTELNLTYKLGGTEKDATGVVSAALRMRYEKLQACTTAERKEIVKITADNVPTVQCAFGVVSTQTYDAAAKKLTTDVGAKDILTKGFPLVSYTKDSESGKLAKKSVMQLKVMGSTSLILSWVLLICSALFMALLFTPAGINFVASGLIVLLGGLPIAFLGNGLTHVEILKQTLGQPIQNQGVCIILFGIALIAIGIWQMVKPEKDESVLPAPAPTPAPVQPETKPVEKKKKK